MKRTLFLLLLCMATGLGAADDAAPLADYFDQKGCLTLAGTNWLDDLADHERAGVISSVVRSLVPIGDGKVMLPIALNTLKRSFVFKPDGLKVFAFGKEDDSAQAATMAGMLEVLAEANSGNISLTSEAVHEEVVDALFGAASFNFVVMALSLAYNGAEYCCTSPGISMDRDGSCSSMSTLSDGTGSLASVSPATVGFADLRLQHLKHLKLLAGCIGYLRVSSDTRAKHKANLLKQEQAERKLREQEHRKRMMMSVDLKCVGRRGLDRSQVDAEDSSSDDDARPSGAGRVQASPSKARLRAVSAALPLV